MLRSVAITSALLLVAQAGVAVARTDGEPAAGCGSSEAYLRSGRLDDLPGCDGELPPGAVEASRAQRDGKLALMRVGRFLLDEDRAQTAAALERAEEAVARLEALGAVGGAAGQLPLFRRALSILVARRPSASGRS